MRSSAVHSKHENALSVVAAVHTYGAFLLAHHDRLWIYNDSKVPKGLRQRVRQMSVEIYRTLTDELRAELTAGDSFRED
jgi:hypothetical protein